MVSSKLERSIRVVWCVTVAALVAVAGSSLAHAGTISYIPITGDADCEIGTSKTYIHKIDCGSGDPAAEINGVAFDRVASASAPALGFDLSLFSGDTTGIGPHVGNSAHNVTGNLADLLTDMLYTGSNSPGAVTRLTLSGLTAGQSYDTRIYTRAWAVNATTRTANITFDPDGTGAGTDTLTITIDEDDASKTPPGFSSYDQAYMISYEFTAEGTELTIDFEQLYSNQSWHLYGVTTEAVPEPSTICLLVFGGLGLLGGAFIRRRRR